MRLFHQLVVSTLVLGLCVSTAEAQFGGTINIGGKKLGLSSGDAKKKLRALDSRLEPAFRIANQKYGRNAAQELTKLQEAEAIVAGVEKDMSGTLKLAGSEYSRVENRIKDVKSKIAIGYLNQKCSAARAAINETNRTGKIASEEQLKALDDAVAALRKAAPNGAGAKFFGAEATRLRADQPAIAKKAAANAQKQQAKQQRQATENASKAIRAISKNINEKITKNEGPISADELSKFDAALEEVKAVSPSATAWWLSERRRIGIYNAFHTKDPAKVAAAVGGELVTGGRTNGKQFKLAIKAKAGWCYSMWSRWAVWSGGEKYNNFKWETKSKSKLQRYDIWARKKPYNSTRGFCALKAMTVTATADLQFAGSRNGLEYTVVGWAKADFPVEESVDMDVSMGDICDLDSWKSHWTDPVPGNLVWKDGEPYLMANPDSQGSQWVGATSLSGARDVRLQKKVFTDAPTGNVVVKSQVGTPRCFTEVSLTTSALSTKYAKCRTSTRKKYAKLFEKAHERKKRARTVSAYNSAKLKIKKLSAQESKETKAKCGPTKQKLTKGFQKLFDELVDSFTDNPPKNVNGRAARAKAEAY